MKIFYNKKLKALSRELRKKGTLSEVLLWNVLKGRKIKGYQFMRQKPIGDYIVDFFCTKLKLVIEIDGISHNDKGEGDRIRQKKLESLGLSVLRFYDWDVKRIYVRWYNQSKTGLQNMRKKAQPHEPPFENGSKEGRFT